MARPALCSPHVIPGPWLLLFGSGGPPWGSPPRAWGSPAGQAGQRQGQTHLVLLVHSLGFEQEVRVAHHHHHVLELRVRGRPGPQETAPTPTPQGRSCSLEAGLKDRGDQTRRCQLHKGHLCLFCHPGLAHSRHSISVCGIYRWERVHFTLARAAALVSASIQSNSSRRRPRMYLMSSTSCCTCKARAQGSRAAQGASALGPQHLAGGVPLTQDHFPGPRLDPEQQGGPWRLGSRLCPVDRKLTA